MRILFWSGTFWPSIGGVEVLAANLLPALRDRGHEFIVIAPQIYSDLPDETQYRGIPVYRFPFWRGFSYFLEIRQQIANLKHTFAPELVHINAVGPANFFHLTTNGVHRAPLLVTLHGEWQSQTETIVRNTLRAADWVAGCSAAILDRGRQLAPEITTRSSIIYNGLEAPSLQPESLPFSAPRILCLGRLAPEKGFDLALAAFRSITDRFPKARLIIAGNGVLRAALEGQAAAHGLDQVVEFTGWIAPETVPSLINACTIVLMPSRQDSLPLVALETALMARPIVATNVGGLPEVVVHQQTGLLVEKEDIRGLADAVTHLLDHPEAAISMGQAARKRAQTVFSWERHVDAYDALYKKFGKQELSVHGDQSSIYRRNNDSRGNKI
jgi:glycosyltransferase involved in cell wall biosynthesis